MLAASRASLAARKGIEVRELIKADTLGKFGRLLLLLPDADVGVSVADEAAESLSPSSAACMITSMPEAENVALKIISALGT
mgnify:CR=1 FL=1